MSLSYITHHNTVLCDSLNVSQIVCDGIQKGHSIEKFQHHPTHHISSLFFHAEICHVILIHIRSKPCTSFLELRRMDSSKNAEHSQVILIKERSWGLCQTYQNLPKLPYKGNWSSLKGCLAPIWSLSGTIIRKLGGLGWRVIKGVGWKESNWVVFTTANNSTNNPLTFAFKGQACSYQ